MFWAEFDIFRTLCGEIWLMIVVEYSMAVEQVINIRGADGESLRKSAFAATIIDVS